MSVCICLSVFTKQPRWNTRKLTKYLDLSLGYRDEIDDINGKYHKFDKLINYCRTIFRKPNNKTIAQRSF